MSKFCGKCDFCDHLWINSNSAEEMIKKLRNTEVYISTGKDGRKHRLAMETELDAARYYPYLTSMSWGSKDGGDGVILTSRPYIDYEEQEHLSWRIRDVLKYWRKCKRNKIPFNKEECYNKVTFLRDNDSALKEIICRVAEIGDKASFEGIYLPMAELYRKQWYKELVRLGEDPARAYCWCFGELFPFADVVQRRLGEEIPVE